MRAAVIMGWFFCGALGLVEPVVAVVGVVRIEPADAKANEPVSLVIESREGLTLKRIQFLNGVFTAEMEAGSNTTAPLVNGTITAALGRLPAGTYQAIATTPFHEPIRDALPFQINETPTNAQGKPTLSGFDVAGLWWDPTRAGEGLTFSRVGNDDLFGTFYVSGTDSSSPWFVIQGCRLELNRCVAPLLRARKGVDGALVVTEAGRIDVLFESSQRAVLVYRIGFLPEVTMKLERLDY